MISLIISLAIFFVGLIVYCHSKLAPKDNRISFMIIFFGKFIALQKLAFQVWPTKRECERVICFIQVVQNINVFRKKDLLFWKDLWVSF